MSEPISGIPWGPHGISVENEGWGRGGSDWTLTWEVAGTSYKAHDQFPGVISAASEDGTRRTLTAADETYRDRLSELATCERLWQMPGWPDVFRRHNLDRESSAQQVAEWERERVEARRGTTDVLQVGASSPTQVSNRPGGAAVKGYALIAAVVGLGILMSFYFPSCGRWPNQ